MSESRLASSVLIITIGSTHNAREYAPERYTSLTPGERRRVVHARIDTDISFLTSLGHPRRELFPLELPASVQEAFAQGRCPDDLRAEWYPGHRPRLTRHGGNGVIASGWLAAAWAVPELRPFLEERMSAALAPVLDAGDTPMPGNELLVVVRSFIGSTTGAALVIPVALLLNNLLAQRNISSWTAAFLSLPDAGQGIGAALLGQRRANAGATLLSLAAIDRERVRCLAAGEPLLWTLGGQVLPITRPLYDEMVVYGGDTAAGSLSERQVGRAMARTLGLYLTRGTGTGAEMRRQQVFAQPDNLHQEQTRRFAMHTAAYLTVDRATAAR